MSTATDMLALYITAEKKVLSGQSYTINNRSLTRANLSEITKNRQYWQTQVNRETAATQGGNSLYSVADWSE